MNRCLPMRGQRSFKLNHPMLVRLPICFEYRSWPEPMWTRVFFSMGLWKVETLGNVSWNCAVASISIIPPRIQMLHITREKSHFLSTFWITFRRSTRMSIEMLFPKSRHCLKGNNIAANISIKLECLKNWDYKYTTWMVRIAPCIRWIVNFTL